YIINRRRLEALKIEHAGALAAAQIVDDDIANHGRERAFLAFLIIEIDGEHRVTHLANFDVPIIKILEPAAAQRVVLEAQRHPEIRTVEVAVLGKDVADAA